MKLISIEKKKYNWKYSESTFFGSDISNELKLVLHIDYDVIIVNSEQETSKQGCDFVRTHICKIQTVLSLPNNLP